VVIIFEIEIERLKSKNVDFVEGKGQGQEEQKKGLNCPFFVEKY
jgi:hypothetical protein